MSASRPHASTHQPTHGKHSQLGSNPPEGVREGRSERDDDDNIERSAAEGARKIANDQLSKLEYGWLCNYSSGHHCTEDETNGHQPETDIQCSGLNCSLVKTSHSSRVRIFPSSHARLAPLLLEDHNTGSNYLHNHASNYLYNHDTAWFHIQCRTFYKPMGSQKYCPKCTANVGPGDYAYICVLG